MLEKQAPIKTELEELESAIVRASLDITKDRPFKFVHGPQNYFLPSMQDACELLGVKHNATTMLDRLEEAGVKRPNISSSALHEIGRNGVGKSVFKRFMSVFTQPIAASLMSPMLRFLLGKNEELERASRVSINALQWLSFSKSLNAQPSNNFRCLSSFIVERSNKQVELLERVKAASAGGNSNQSLSSSWGSWVTPLYLEHSLINEEVLNFIGELVKEELDTSQLDKHQTSVLVRCMFDIEYDFYLNLLASYEVDYVVSHGEEPKTDKRWLISKVLKRYTHKDNSHTSTRCLVAVLLEWFKEHDIDFTFTDLASCVPYQASEGTTDEVDVLIAQKNKLHKWLRSIDLPSHSALNDFLEVIAAKTGTTIDYGLGDVFSSVFAIDRALMVKSSLVNKEFGDEVDVFSIWKQCFGAYSEYYKFHCERYEGIVDSSL
ncbi:hypothetical protein [Vibrio parahaemolyticus]|uniref:hypothetical protein n=2 Tax=Vibrio parahaemolyticus TaxID=670 RepID=UPI0023602AD7|nr:hypothetical protein [Vibrio parahaemolyticus]